MRSSLLIAASLVGASLALAPAVHAQEPDKLCKGLENAIAAAAEPRPFIALVPAGQSHGSLPKLNTNPAGFGDFFHCELYRAGNAVDGVIGGGPYNRFRCLRARTDSHAMPDGGAADIESHTLAIAQRVNACLSPLEWTASTPLTKDNYEDQTKTWRFTPPSGDTEILVEMETDAPSRGGRSTVTTTFWRGWLIIRVPNPTHPKS